MTRRPSSRRWLERHFNDPYVKRVRADGYRSRAAYKLLEIQAKDAILRSGMRVVDLGAAPGSWSQVARTYLGPQGQIVALDRLRMEPLEGVTILQGDFREEAVWSDLYAVLGEMPVDLVLSDMAPNITGMAVVDQARALGLAELALEFARAHLKTGGALVVKVFQGAGFDAYLRELRASFDQVAVRKPQSSRSESRETFLVAKGFCP
ncbi:RlmE family RNA methyltransferase [Caldichromatium japonicum]|uniref:Ribosomal RNA large subunit methyltransferase E n=1 Tax=Caldichromatium japonicum TaxID=2699430 RepID=A0A6G7VEM1_9GAMM|nr:RlmE family RNA methyltransferase [Caldichromatium japonicum]QIK38489.1 RlmE family RNA methyltransferase [Caldichromatium japonicum]